MSTISMIGPGRYPAWVAYRRDGSPVVGPHDGDGRADSLLAFWTSGDARPIIRPTGGIWHVRRLDWASWLGVCLEALAAGCEWLTVPQPAGGGRLDIDHYRMAALVQEVAG